MYPRVGLRFVTLVAAVVLLAAAAPAAEPGETCWVGGRWFQALGTDEQGRDLWLYPHTDGVPELFVDAGRNGSGRDVWVGSLDSSFDPAKGGFTRLFNAAEVLNELAEADGEARRRPARLLATFLALYPATDGPYYLREARDELAPLLEPADLADVAERVALHRATLARVARPGTRVLEPPASPVTLEEHQAALVEDGYLDVAVVGGNSQDPGSQQRYSWDLLAALAADLERQGYGRGAFRSAADATRCERVAELLGRRVRVRVQLTGGSGRADRTRRAVANFVEGLVRADVVIYVGHSNHDSGAYYLSEKRSEDARFRIGAGAEGEDLALKLPGLGARPHQLLFLHSCVSYPKYCEPLVSHIVAGGQRGPGVVGTTRVAYFDEFLPRASALLRGLVEGAGGAALHRAMVRATEQASRRPDASPIVLRGCLQPRRTFVVPAGVRIERVEERGADDAFLVVGEGSDGRRYVSTELFPQDRPGDVVQVAAADGAALALRRDGSLALVREETEGACVELAGPYRALAVVSLRGGRSAQVCAVSAAGRLLVLEGRALGPLEPPPPFPVTAVGNDARGRVVALGATGAAVWRSSRRAWEPTARVALVDPAPSLLSGAELFLGEGPTGRVLSR